MILVNFAQNERCISTSWLNFVEYLTHPFFTCKFQYHVLIFTKILQHSIECLTLQLPEVINKYYFAIHCLFNM